MSEPIVLDVYVSGRLVGNLVQTGTAEHVFTYLPDVNADDFVSLTMRVGPGSISWLGGLHPIFQMNLPEGYQKDLLREQLGPVAVNDDLNLLAITGRRTIGRVQVVPHGLSLSTPEINIDLANLLASTGSQQLLLQHLHSGITEGVAGVMPKALAAPLQQKATAATDSWIIKTGPEHLPGLSINEYLCLEVARKAGLAVPETNLSGDGQVLAIRRFDRDAEGRAIGFEDFCSLSALAPYEKYKSTSEQLAARLIDYVTPAYLEAAKEQLFTLMVVNYALRNADAHLKNYGLIYTGGQDIRLAPAYDIVTVPAYPDYLKDIPGLPMQGTRRWEVGKHLPRFARERLNLTKENFVPETIERVSQAMSDIAPEVEEMANTYPEFRETAKRMMHFWDKGRAGIQLDAKMAQGRPSLKEKSGLSDEKKKPKPSRNPYEPQDGAFSHKSR